MRINIGALSVFAAAVMWGTAGIFVKALSACGVEEMSIVMLRAAFSTLMLGSIILFSNPSCFKIKLKDAWGFTGSGVLSIVLFNFCYYRTMELSSLAVAAVLLYTAPIFVVIISAVIFKEKLTFKKSISCIIAFLGCVLVSGIIGNGGYIGAEGLVFGLLTGFGYSLYTIFGNILIKKGYSSFTITFYTFLFAFIGSLPLCDFENVFGVALTVKAIPNTVSNSGLSLVFAGFPVILVSVLMALCNTVIPYIFYTDGLKSVSPSTAPIIATVEPVVAAILGMVIYKEKMTVFGLLGVLLILGSVIILSYRGDKK